jgi:rod shape-determining protein MreD
MRRFLILLLIAYLFAILQSAIFGEIFPPFLKPDLMLIYVVHLGIFSPLWMGAFLALLAGLFTDTFAGSPLGLFIFTYLSIFFLIKLLAKFLILGEAISFRMILVFFAMIFQVFWIILVPRAIGIFENISFPRWIWVVSQILITCAICWPCFQFIKKLDAVPAADLSETV